MKRLLSADFFEFRKSKMTYLLLAISVLMGIFLPLMYFGLGAMMKYMGGMEALQGQEYVSSLDALVDSLNGRTVFLSVLPISQGIGLVITAMVGFRAVRPFGTGIYRNKVIAQIKRSSIYLSQSLFCLILTMVSAALYTVTAALTTRIAFGEIGLSGRETAVIALLSALIYLVYTAIPVFVAFMTRSVPLTIIISLLLPILMQTVVQFAGAALVSAPDTVINLLAVLPSFQNLFLMSANATDTVLVISAVSDVLIAAALTAAGILRFRKADMN